MGWRLKPEPTMSSLEGSLIREIGARNLLGTAVPERSTHRSPGNAFSPRRLRYNSHGDHRFECFVLSCNDLSLLSFSSAHHVS